MNERIKEIRAKAVIPVQKDGYTSWGFSEEKFAELLIRECAEKCSDMKYVNPQPHHYAAMIKEHFGVSE